MVQKKLNIKNKKVCQKLLKTKILNSLILNGNKLRSEKIVLNLFKLIYKLYKKNPIKLLKISIITISPILFIRKIKRKKKLLFEIPYLLKPSMRIFYSLKEIIGQVKKKKETAFYIKLQQEFFSIVKRDNASEKLKDNIHKLAFQKKPFSHFRWF
nr:ribosomal protein S7 [Stephanopyxis turris]